MSDLFAARTVQALIIQRPGQAAVVEIDGEALPEGHFRVDTRFSGVSAGTELTWFRGTNPWLQSSLDPDLLIFRPGLPGAGFPVTRLGYMEVGRVVASRTTAVAEGTLLAMAYGHRTGYDANPLGDRFVVLPESLDPLLGIYAAHMGPICANGLLHAAADAVGPTCDLDDGVRDQTVLVTGAGVVGLLTALFAKALGAAEVAVVDRTPQRLQAAEAMGFVAVDETQVDVPLMLKTRWAHGRGDHGADVAFQCRGQPAALATALRSVRPQATVVDLAFYVAGCDEVRLGEEFHHNGLALRCAQIGRVPRGLAHRWDRERLSRATVDLLLDHGDTVRRHLITDMVPLSHGPKLLAELSQRSRHVLSAVLEMDPTDTAVPNPPGRAQRRTGPGSVRP